MKRCNISMGSFSLRLLGIGALALVAVTAPLRGARAADFAVSPMILEIERGARSGEIRVRNLDQQPIRFQVRGTDWSQDESGKNIYTDSKSLIWFPRALELAPGESRIIRVGVRAMPASQEQAYTISLQETPVAAAQMKNARGAQVRLLLSVSVPVFVPPAKPVPGGTIESIELRGGSLNAVVANRGNRHFRYREAMIVGMGADGTEQFTEKVRGRTLLAGSRQELNVKIPQNICGRLSGLALTLTTSEKSEIKRRLDVSRADCE